MIEFLHRVVDTFDDYFSECTESIIKENYVVVYEVSSPIVKHFYTLKEMHQKCNVNAMGIVNR